MFWFSWFSPPGPSYLIILSYLFLPYLALSYLIVSNIAPPGLSYLVAFGCLCCLRLALLPLLPWLPLVTLVILAILEVGLVGSGWVWVPIWATFGCLWLPFLPLVAFFAFVALVAFGCLWLPLQTLPGDLWDGSGAHRLGGSGPQAFP